MVEAIVVFGLSLMPPLISVWVMRKAEVKAREALQAARTATAVRSLQTSDTLLERHYVEGVGYLVGDITCQYNARSSYLRCAVNPFGPCQECPYYQVKESLDIDF